MSRGTISNIADLDYNIADMFPDPVTILDMKGNILWCNKASYELTQLTPNDVIGKRFTKLASLRAKEIPGYVKIFTAILSGKFVDPINVNWTHQDGTIAVFESRINLIKLPNGKRAVQVISRDLTELKAAELIVLQEQEALKASETRLKRAQQVAKMGFLTWTLNTNEIQWSDEVFNIYRVDKKKVQPTLDYTVSLVHPDDLTYVQENLDAVVKGKEDYDIDHRVVRPDGETIWIHAQGELLYDSSGTPTYLLGSVVDITKRKQVEEKLRKSETVLNATGKMAKVGGWELDAKTMGLTYTEETCRIHEIPVGQVPLLDDAINFYHPDEREGLSAAIQRALDHGEPYDLELRFITAKGNDLLVHAICNPQVIDGKTVKLTGTFQDVTIRRQAEQALVESELRFRGLFEKSPVGIELFDVEGQLIDANQATLDIFGVSDVDEIMGFKLFEDPNLTDEVKEKLRKGESVDYQTEFDFEAVKKLKLYETSKSGIVHLDLMISPMILHGGDKTDSYIVHVRDITETRLAQDVIAERESFLQSIFGSIQDGISILDTEMNILRVNKKMEEWYSHKKPLVGKKCYEAYQGRSKLCEPCPSRRALDNNEMAVDIVHMTGPEGRIEGWLEVYSFPLHDLQTGSLLGVIEYVRDITAQVEAENSLKESEAKFRSVFEQAAVGVARVRQSGSIIEANLKLEQMLGYSNGELVGIDVFKITSEEDSEIEKQFSAQLLAGNRDSYTMEKRFFRKDGSIMWGRLTVSVARNSLGDIDFTIGVLEDITDEKQTQRNLLESETRFRSIVESAGVGIAIVDSDDHILEANQHFQRLLGYNLDEIKQMTIAEFTHPEDAETDRILFGEIMDGKRNSYQMEKRYIRKDGATLWTHLTVSVVRDIKGVVNFIIGIIHDITETVHARESLVTSAQRYRELIMNLPAGVGITDNEERLQIVNPSICELLGYAEDELIGMRILDTIIPEDHDRILSETKLRITGQSSTYETQIVRKDGAIRDVRISGVPRRNLQGEVIGTIGLITDISEAKRAQDELVASEQWIRSLIEQLPLGIAIVDLNERIELVNQAFSEMIRFEKTALIGSNMADYIDPEQLNRIQDEINDRKLGAKSNYEVDMIRGDDVRRRIKISAAPNLDGFENVIGSVGVFEDITEQIRNEAIQIQQEQEINLYSSLLRHDMINDLGLILSYIEAVQMLMESPDDELVSFLNSALATVERMSNLLKSFGRPQEVRVVDIVEFIKEIADEAQEAEKELKVSIMYKKGSKDIRITAGGLVSLVFMNLFRNAAQHGGETPEVEVLVSKKQNQIEIMVSDNGPGIPKKYHKKLFTRGLSSKGEAGGLGLHLCKQIVEQTGGSIKHQKAKEGATFQILLPLK